MAATALAGLKYQSGACQNGCPPQRVAAVGYDGKGECEMTRNFLIAVVVVAILMAAASCVFAQTPTGMYPWSKATPATPEAKAAPATPEASAKPATPGAVIQDDGQPQEEISGVRPQDKKWVDDLDNPDLRAKLLKNLGITSEDGVATQSSQTKTHEYLGTIIAKLGTLQSTVTAILIVGIIAAILALLAAFPGILGRGTPVIIAALLAGAICAGLGTGSANASGREAPSAWARPFTDGAVQAGVFEGDKGVKNPNNTYRWGQPATRQEVAVVCGIMSKGTTSYTDQRIGDLEKRIAEAGLELSPSTIPGASAPGASTTTPPAGAPASAGPAPAPTAAPPPKPGAATGEAGAKPTEQSILASPEQLFKSWQGWLVMSFCGLMTLLINWGVKAPERRRRREAAYEISVSSRL